MGNDRRTKWYGAESWYPEECWGVAAAINPAYGSEEPVPVDEPRPTPPANGQSPTDIFATGITALAERFLEEPEASCEDE